jgi:phosphoglucosamine mutase
VEKIDTAVPKLFGTDGIRGTAGHPPLDATTMRRLGAALIKALPAQGHAARILIGRDTRESGTWIEEELARGANAEGAAVTTLGVIPTPAVAYLTRNAAYDAGLVISASHNPFEDNGVKVFSSIGEKISEAAERRIEALIADRTWTPGEATASESTSADLVAAYLDHLRPILSQNDGMRGLTLAVDCANGATTTVAPGLFRALGFSVVLMADEPDGRNINLQCGSTHPQALADLVVRSQAQLGVAFDGDGDRAIFVDHAGHIVDGDAVLLMCARQMQREGRLKNDAIVATVMSNIGLEIALKESGIGMVRCPVGDKYVMEEMSARGLSLGGEQSGHIIFADYLSTGDGLCTALNVLRTMAVSGRSLADLAGELVTYPQVLLNLRVKEKRDVRSIPAAQAAIEKVEAEIGSQGRLLVRYSGTEPLLRVMIEGKDQQQIQIWAQSIIDVVKQEIG